jgi:cytochrome o ubiquinol oxidase subunit 2
MLAGSFTLRASEPLKSLSSAAICAPLILTLAGCSGGVLDPQGAIGRADAKILLDALGAMLLIVVPTIAATLVFA